MLVAASGVVSSRAHAQLGDVKLAAASYEYNSYTDSKRSETNPDGGDVAFQAFKAILMVPITLAEDRTLFIPGFATPPSTSCNAKAIDRPSTRFTR